MKGRVRIERRREEKEGGRGQGRVCCRKKGRVWFVLF